jgi:hypothetical protein
MNGRLHPWERELMRFAFAFIVGLAAAAPAALGQKLYFADILSPTFEDGSINRVNVDGTGHEVLFPVGGGLRSLDVHAAAGKVYWANVDLFAIQRANLDGTGVEVFSTGYQFPMAVRLDLGRSWLWVGDISAEEVSYVSVPGGGSPQLWQTTPFFRGLAVAGDDLYHTTSLSPTTGQVIRTPVVGLPAVLINQGKPSNIAIDAVHGKIYWTDAALRNVRSADLNGQNVQTLFPGNSYQVRGIAVDPVGGKVYWGQDMTDKGVVGAIWSMNLDGSDAFPLLQGLGFVNDIVLVPGEGPVPCYPNCDESTTPPILNVADFGCFLQKFAASDPYANCDGSTQAPVLNVADFGCFLQAFAAGCR